MTKKVYSWQYIPTKLKNNLRYNFDLEVKRISELCTQYAIIYKHTHNTYVDTDI